MNFLTLANTQDHATTVEQTKISQLLGLMSNRVKYHRLFNITTSFSN